MSTLALVAISARIPTQAAVRDGYQAVAIDAFGDLDTRRACVSWLPATAPGSFKLDIQRVLGHLRQLARDPEVIGWVAGSGCEGDPQLLAAGAAVLPLLGCAPSAVHQVRDPQGFAAWLHGHGLTHPEVRFSPPVNPTDWLLKDALGCGGWHVRPASQALGPPQVGHYYQRRAPGRAMSATFCANGSAAVVLGCNEAVPHAGGLPFVHGGVIGPVELPRHVDTEIRRAVNELSRDLQLKGLGSLDFLFDGQTACMLEVNPRPSASMALYVESVPGGLMRAHVQACLLSRLPQVRPHGVVRGECIVFAPRDMQVDSLLSQALQGRPDCHDQPAGGTALHRGDPLCSVSASGPNIAAVRQLLQQRHDAVLNLTESLP